MRSYYHINNHTQLSLIQIHMMPKHLTFANFVTTYPPTNGAVLKNYICASFYENIFFHTCAEKAATFTYRSLKNAKQRLQKGKKTLITELRH